MRVMVVRAALVGLAVVALSGCNPGRSLPTVTLARVDPDEAAERAIVGAALGTALGTGIATTASINPAIGSIIGAETGAAIGAAIGAATAQPLPDYKPIPVPVAAVVPGFYDTWPPGDHPPPIVAQAPPPPPG